MTYTENLVTFVPFTDEKRQVIKKSYYGHGKLLLTGEYGVLDGALALGLPTKFGQHLRVKPSRGSDLVWESKDMHGETWFNAQISLFDFSAVKTTDEKIAKHIGKILKSAVRLNSEFLDKWNGFKVITELEFERGWGLGSSSTLIHTVAEWANVNPFFLHFKVSNGSGYDVACAGASGPIQYRLDGDQLSYSEIDLHDAWKEFVYFIYLGRKADSAEAVNVYKTSRRDKKRLCKELSNVSEELTYIKKYKDFNEQIERHESLMSSALGMPKVKNDRFSDYWGSMKSLGAWGGDFVLATSDRPREETQAYFKEKGYPTFFAWDEIILGAEVPESA